jgi:hypothetical protein
MPQISTVGSDPTKGSGDWLTEECDVILSVEEYKEAGVGTEDYHCLITAVVHSSTVPSQVGKKVKDQKFFFLKSQNKIFELSCALGLYTKPKWEQDVAAGAAPNIPLEGCGGMMFATPVRHKKWREPDDTQYWSEQLQVAKQNGDEKKAKRCQDVLQAKRGMLQIGGDSGFTFWALGDPQSDGIPIDAATMAMLSATFPHGLPTKMGTPRKRGESAGPQMPAKKTAPSNGNGGAAPAQQPAGAGFGSQFV